MLVTARQIESVTFTTPNFATLLAARLRILASHFTARKFELESQAGSVILAGRITLQPTMAWNDGYRMQPRDGRGRFLPRTWLAAAEVFTAADAQWFRSPVSSTEGK
jgi:hypothetical protein